MTEMIMIKVATPHGNSFGGKYSKNKGDEYEVPRDLAVSMLRDGLIEDFEHADQVRGRAGTGGGVKPV